MRKMRKSLSAVLCLLMLASLLTVFAGASGVDSLRIVNVQPSENRLRVYTSYSGTNVTTDMFAAELGSVPAPVIGVETAVTSRALVYCMVDTSSALEPYALQRNKDVLNGIAETLANGDAMVIRTTCQPASKPIPNREDAKRYISSLPQGKTTTDIFAGIQECLKECESLSPNYDMVCLVVVCSGLNSSRTSAAQNSVIASVQASRIPVYTINTRLDTDAARILASFSSASAGGTTFSHRTGNENYITVGENIMLNLKQSVVLTLDVSDSKDRAEQMDELTLRVQFSNGSGVLSDSCHVFSTDLIFSGNSDSIDGYNGAANGDVDPDVNLDPTTDDPTIELPTGETYETTEPEIDEPTTIPETSEKNDEEFPIVLVAAGGGGALLLIIIAVVLIVSRKKKLEAERIAAEQARKQEAEKKAREEARKRAAERRRAEEAQRRAEDEAARASQMAEEQARFAAEEAARRAAEQAAAQAREEAYRASLPTVRFVGIGENNLKIDLQMEPDKIYVLGRSNASDLILNPNDPHLSSRHCQIRLKNDHLDIIDSMSRNGTFVNGVPIRDKGMFGVTDKDIVKIGSFDYRILIMK